MICFDSNIKWGVKMIELNKIYNIDCLKGIKKLPDECVDLVLTDPPYNISQKNNLHTMKSGKRTIDFGEWDYEFDQEYWIKKVSSKVKTGGSIIIFNALENMGDIKKALEDNGFTFKEFLTWEKTNPMPRNRDRLYVTARETAIWAVKGRGWVFNRQKSTYENGFFKCPLVHHSKRIHKTQKPIELMEDLIKIHSNKGDVVLDPFSGSASTAVSCINLGRNYIGFELDEEYFKLSLRRVEDIKGEF